MSNGKPRWNLFILLYSGMISSPWDTYSMKRSWCVESFWKERSMNALLEPGSWIKYYKQSAFRFSFLFRIRGRNDQIGRTYFWKGNISNVSLNQWNQPTIEMSRTQNIDKEGKWSNICHFIFLKLFWIVGAEKLLKLSPEYFGYW